MKLIRPYRGAGVLFYHRNAAGQLEVLMARRRNGGWWSIPGGEMEPRDGRNHWETGKREAVEEFGEEGKAFFPPAGRVPKIGFTLPGFLWYTYLVPIQQKPDAHAFPDKYARDYHEFTEHRWFNLATDPRPKRLYGLMYPSLLRLDLWAALKWFFHHRLPEG